MKCVAAALLSIWAAPGIAGNQEVGVSGGIPSTNSTGESEFGKESGFGDVTPTGNSGIFGDWSFKPESAVAGTDSTGARSRLETGALMGYSVSIPLVPIEYDPTKRMVEAFTVEIAGIIQLPRTFEELADGKMSPGFSPVVEVSSDGVKIGVSFGVPIAGEVALKQNLGTDGTLSYSVEVSAFGGEIEASTPRVEVTADQWSMTMDSMMMW